MVRTYKEDDYHLLSPWEKAMRNADSVAESPVTTGKRTYKKISSSPIASYNEYKSLKLPPITEDPQQTIEFLGEEVGKVFLRSKRKLKTIKSEFVLYDPLQTGRMQKTAAYEILKRYKLPPNDNYQRKIVAFFVTSDEPGKVDRVKMMDFLENSSLQYHKIAEMKKQDEELVKPIERKFNDSTYGRYDSEATSCYRDYEPRKGEVVQKAFSDRRDAGLSIEIERAFKASGQDPHEIIDRLEMSIDRTTLNVRQNELKLVDNMHLKGLVAKHQFPINAALTLKCIERLDPYNNGEIEWPKFIDFLRKAVCSIPPSRNTRSPMSLVSPISSTTLNSGKAPWEIKKPLQGIKNISGLNEGYSMPTDVGTAPSVVTLHSYPAADYQQSYSNGSDDFQSNNANSFTSNNWDSFPTTMDNSRDNSRDNSHAETDLPAIYVDTHDDEIEALSARGEVYKRVAGALNDRAMLNNGLVSTNDVRKTVNYYNMLFDADINLEKLNASLDKNSKNDYVKVDLIINSFGKGIV